jgi:hypothetical protein
MMSSQVVCVVLWGKRCRLVWCLLAGVLVFPVSGMAAEQAVTPRYPQVGECVIFREGGGGYVFKAPTYWLKGTIAGLFEERRTAGLCPKIGKPETAYSSEDWIRVAAATPCVQNAAEVREVSVLRVQVKVDAWETPWSNQHGTAGWLFRGQFLDKPLHQGETIDMDASWLERCE